jgi:alkanesulfonate monooxygenase SsuD/methylene tetrahydromethanopterin reductase-like flavin-dependent oxidoreductase (luciferase family)
MEFGIFDHLDRNSPNLPELYNQRLQLVELYDQLGFYGYHVAEHHSTPLGMAPSPSVYIASVIQRTKRLRIGPLVYLLPLYHPLRLIEEICMLDNLSGGRLQVGVGRGISPIELGYYGRVPEEAKEIFDENLEILLRGLSAETLTFSGKFNSFNNTPMSLRPLQSPHPPIWLGISSVESAAFAAKSGFNIVGLMSAATMKSRVDAYRDAMSVDDLGERKVGISYLIVVGENDADAMRAASSAYRRWHASFHHLYRINGRQPMLGAWPEEFAELVNLERAIAGSPQTVARFLQKAVDTSGINYVLAQMMFGDLPFDTARRSIDLFAEKVIPRFKARV